MTVLVSAGIVGLLKYLVSTMSDEIIKLLNSLDTKFDAKFNSLDTRLTEIDTKFDAKFGSLSVQLEVVASTVLEHSEKFISIEKQLKILVDVVTDHGEKLKALEDIKERVKDFPTSHQLRETIEKLDQLLNNVLVDLMTFHLLLFAYVSMPYFTVNIIIRN